MSKSVRHYTIRRDHRPPAPAAEWRDLLEELGCHYTEFFGHPAPPSTTTRWTRSTIEELRRYLKHWAALIAATRDSRRTPSAVAPSRPHAAREPETRSEMLSAAWQQGRLFDPTSIVTVSAGRAAPAPVLASALSGKAVIKGLSLTRPWPFAFTSGPAHQQKRVENRSWPPPPHMLGQYLALHAAQSWSEADRQTIARLTKLAVPRNAECPSGEIFAVCRLVGYLTRADDPKLIAPQRQWFFGPYGWLLDEFMPLLTPVRCRGGQQLWRLDTRHGVLEALLESYREATSSI